MSGGNLEGPSTANREVQNTERAPDREPSGSTNEGAETFALSVAPGITAQRIVNSQSVRPADVLALQRSVGNRAVLRLLAKRASYAETRDENGVAGGAEAVVDRAASSIGYPPPDAVRNRFGGSLGSDLSEVHAGRESTDAAEAIGAKAYPVGQNIHFGARHHAPAKAERVHLLAHEVAHTGSLNRAIDTVAFTTGTDIFSSEGAYRPEGSAGRQLLADELTHVVRQSGNWAQGKLVLGEPGNSYEREAEAASPQIANGNFGAERAAGVSDLRGVQRKGSQAGEARAKKIHAKQGASGVVQRSPNTSQAEEPAQSESNAPRSIRVTIVGHASPRWTGAANNKEADRLNEVLARERADAVLAEVRKRLLQEFANVPIEVNTSRAEDESPREIEVGASGVGSRETITQAGGDRTRNDEHYRRVEVNVEMVSSSSSTSKVSLPSEAITSKYWRVKINRLEVIKAVLAGGGIEIELTNADTGKQFLATAHLVGVGRPGLNPFSTEQPTGDSRLINVQREIGIKDFDGTEIVVTRGDLKVGLGESYIGLEFPDLMPGRGFPMWHKFGIGMPGGFHVWGKLHVFGSQSDFIDPSGAKKVYPKSQLDKYGDNSEYTNPTEDVEAQVKRRSGEGLIVTFPTGKFAISSSEKERIDGFIAVWARRKRS